MPQRIGYIDALRGFTMLLVVFSHVETFSYGIKYNESLLSSFIMSFFMPMFFFISGYMTYRKEKLSWKEYIKKIKNRFVRLVIPAFLIFHIYFTFFRNAPIDLFFTKGPLGFWFTFVLFEMYLIYYTTQLLLIKQSPNKTNFILIGLGIFGQVIFLGSIGHYYNLETYPILTLTNTTRYFIFFILGIVCKQNEETFIKLINNDYIRTSLIILYIISLTLEWNKYLLPHYSILHVLNFEIFIQYLGVFLIFTLFYYYSKNFEKNNIIIKNLRLIGRHTLDIYLLHWFFLPSFSFMKECFIGNKNLLAEFYLTITIVIAVISLCLFISYALRASHFLGYYLWGDKNNYKKDE